MPWYCPRSSPEQSLCQCDSAIAPDGRPPRRGYGCDVGPVRFRESDLDQAQRSYQAEEGASGATLGCSSPSSAPITRTVGRIAICFPRYRAESAVTGDQGLLGRGMCQSRIGDCRIHDLRHTYASILASAGLSLPVIGALLGHTQPNTTARYSHLFDDPLREATERVSSALNAVSGKSV